MHWIKEGRPFELVSKSQTFGNAGVGLGFEFVLMHVLVISVIITSTY
jgi:hypothetical protein